jgi:thiol-disulfide isomerase/thioredoxin
MRPLQIKKLGLFVLVTMLWSPYLRAAATQAPTFKKGECLDHTYSEFGEMVKQQKPKFIVFFASWCLACRKHILESNPAQTVYVIAFDDLKAGQKALWCEGDQRGEIKRAYQVKQLPKTVKLNGSDH